MLRISLTIAFGSNSGDNKQFRGFLFLPQVTIQPRAPGSAFALTADAPDTSPGTVRTAPQAVLISVSSPRIQERVRNTPLPVKPKSPPKVSLRGPLLAGHHFPVGYPRYSRAKVFLNSSSSSEFWCQRAKHGIWKNHA